MKFNIKNIAVMALVYCFSAIGAYATKLPPYIVHSIKADLPKASIRFDGLVTLPDGTVYLPVLPSNPKKNPTGKVVTTYPANKKLSQLPEVVVFDSNFALLKVIKNAKGQITVTDTKNIPFIVKTGLFPQDMLVPPGLIIPEDMKIMMGDLVINVADSRINDILKETTIVDKTNTQKTTKIIPVAEMNDKTLLVTTLDSKMVNVIPSDSLVPKYTLRMENLPKFVQPVGHDKYLLVAAAGKTYVEVADIDQEVIAKKIDLSYQPAEIVVTQDKSRAYIAVLDSQAIFVIDLKNMALLEKIKVKGYPKNIALSDDESALVYSDRNNGDIYTLALDESYLNKYVFNASNVSKLALRGNNVYLLSRTTNELQVVDNDLKDLIYSQELASKPVDMMLKNNKLYILCASNEIDIFNLEDFSLCEKIQLPGGGFSKKLVPVPKSNLVLVTNVLNKNYHVVDLSKNTVVQTVPTNVTISDLQLLNRKVE